MSFARENLARAIASLNAAVKACEGGNVSLALDNISDAAEYIESARGHLNLDESQLNYRKRTGR